MSWLPGGALEFERPAWLLLVLAAPAFYFAVLGRSLADFPRRQLRLQAILRALVLAGVATALAGPTLRRPGSVAVVALVDVSESVGDAALDLARATVTRLTGEAAARGYPPPRVVRFAATPEEITLDGSAPPAVARFAPSSTAARGVPPLAAAATDLALAASFGAGLTEARYVSRLLLISDGLQTRGDLLATADRFRARGLPIFALPLPAPATGDVAVVEIGAPEDIRPRVPFQVDVRLLADRPTTVSLHLGGDDHVLIDEPDQTLALAPGVTTAVFTARVTEPGQSAIRARAVATAGADRHAENDEGVVLIATEREPRVLLLEGAPGVAGALPRALGSEHIATDVRAARALPRGFDIRRYDLVVLADVPRSALPDPTLAALEAFVRQGGGLLVAGGTQSFGPGGYSATRLENLLPVRLDTPDKREDATLALSLVIDKSGSMSGAKMDLTKEAARATAEALPPADQISVIAFDSQATPVVRLQRASNRQRILADISRIQPSGGTNILAGLREGIDELLTARARKKHVILLSDGQSPYDEIPDLVDAAATARITISAVGVGDGADQTLLKMIATRGQGRFYHARDPASIPRIFSRETSELGNPAIVEKPTGARVAKRISALAGAAVETAPALGGYVATRPRAQAETVLVTGDGSPLLARWQLGLGQVAAWTSDLGPRWAASWTRWPAHDKFWAQVARATMRRRAAMRFPIRSTRSGDLVRLAIDAVGPDDRFVVGLDGEVEITGIGATGQAVPARAVPLAEVAPGHYEASFRPEIDAGALLFAATLRSGGLPAADAGGRLALPFAPELRPRPPSSGAAPEGAVLLAAAATRSGGRLVSDGRDALELGQEVDPDRRQTRQPLRTAVLLATLALFLLDILARRVRLDGSTSGP